MNSIQIMRCKKLSQIILLFVCIIFVPLNLLATVVIDVDNFNFPNSQVKGVRIVRFDPDEQKFTGLDYYVQPTAADFTTTFMGLAIDGDCNITIPVTFKLKGIIIRTTGDITLKKLDDDQPKEWTFWETTDYKANGAELTRTVLSFKEIEIKQGSTVMKALNQKSKKATGGKNFSATVHKSKKAEARVFGNIAGDATDNKDERGVLGELATHLTMMSFGYSCRFSKYGTNHGFDGVFLDDSANPELFLSESKCKGRADGVKTILRDELSEAQIASKLKHIAEDEHKALPDDARDLLVETGEEIQGYIDDSPASIFKFAHRVKPDGSCQCLVEKFDIKKYSANGVSVLTPQSPKDAKLAAIKGLMGQLCKTDQDKATLTLSALPGSDREKLSLVLNALGVNQAQQATLLKGITFKGEKVKKTLKYDSKIAA